MGKITSNDILDAMWLDFDARVWRICDYLGIQKQELADEIGMPQQRMSRLKVGRHHSEAYLILQRYPEINARWLLFGQGEMLMSEREQPTAQPMAHHPDLLPPAGLATSTAAYMIPIELYNKVVEENGILKNQLRDIGNLSRNS